MSHYNCCVINCKNTSRNSPCKFYRFPTSSWRSEQRNLWIAAVNRINGAESPWCPRPYDVICSGHFVDGKKSEEPLSPSYFPTIFPSEYDEFNEYTVQQSSNVYSECQTDVLNDETNTGLLVEMKRQPTSRKRKLPKNKPNKKVHKLPIYQKNNGLPTITASVQTQTEIYMDWKKFLTTLNLDRYSLNKILEMPTLSKIVQCLKMLNINETVMKIPDQVILTVWKYRFNLNIDSYSHMFSYNDKTTSINANKLNKIYQSSSENLYKYTQRYEESIILDLECLMSRRFYLDVFEIPVSSHLIFNPMNYSSQRGTTTFKALVMFVGSLQYFYVSDLYGGSTKISHIIRKSQIGNIVRSNDYVIYSKKINRTEAELIHAHILDNVPDEKKVIFSHIETRLRTKFKILNHILPIDSWPIANKIFHNCVTLYNMSLKGCR